MDHTFRLQGWHVVLILDNTSSYKFVTSGEDECEDNYSNDDDDYNTNKDNFSDNDSEEIVKKSDIYNNKWKKINCKR